MTITQELRKKLKELGYNFTPKEIERLKRKRQLLQDITLGAKKFNFEYKITSVFHKIAPLDTKDMDNAIVKQNKIIELFVPRGSLFKGNLDKVKTTKRFTGNWYLTS